MKTYVIRKLWNNEMVNCFEGLDGKARAHELTAIHNRIYAESKWTVCEEMI